MGPKVILDESVIADTAISRYYAVRQTATERGAVANTAGQLVLGIAQEAADATDVSNGRVIRVRTMGVTRAVVDAAYPIQTKLRVAADGRLTALAAATANQNVVGIVRTPSTAANDWVDVFLTIGATAGT